MRFTQTEDKLYALEVSSLKEKRNYNVLDIELHLHETNKDCFILTFEKVKGKIEVFECENASDIYHSFQEYKRMAEDIEEKKGKQQDKAKSAKGLKK